MLYNKNPCSMPEISVARIHVLWTPAIPIPPSPHWQPVYGDEIDT